MSAANDLNHLLGAQYRKPNSLQWAIILGIVFFIGISLVGSHLTSNLQFSGPLKGLEEAVAGKLLKRYDKVALLALISFWVVAFKCYRRNKKRFW